MITKGELSQFETTPFKKNFIKSFLLEKFPSAGEDQPILLQDVFDYMVPKGFCLTGFHRTPQGWDVNPLPYLSRTILLTRELTSDEIALCDLIKNKSNKISERVRMQKVKNLIEKIKASTDFLPTILNVVVPYLAYPSKHGYNCFDNSTLLHWAVLNEYTECLKILISSGTDIEILDAHSRTPLILAIEKHLTKAVNELIKSGADINYQAPYQHWNNTITLLNTPLISAIENDSCVEVLINYGADIDIPSENNIKAIDLAVKKKSNSSILSFIKAGARITNKTINFAQDNPEITKLLKIIQNNYILKETKEFKLDRKPLEHKIVESTPIIHDISRTIVDYLPEYSQKKFAFFHNKTHKILTEENLPIKNLSKKNCIMM